MGVKGIIDSGVIEVWKKNDWIRRETIMKGNDNVALT